MEILVMVVVLIAALAAGEAMPLKNAPLFRCEDKRTDITMWGAE